MCEESSGVQAIDLRGGNTKARRVSRTNETPYHMVCDNSRKQVCQLVTNKDSLVKNLRLVLPVVNDSGSLPTWGFHILDAKYGFLLLSILKHPSNQTSDNPPDGQEADGDETRSYPSPTPSSPTRQAPPPQPPNLPTGTRYPPPRSSRNNRTSRGPEGFGGPYSPHPPPPPSPLVRSPLRNYFP